MEAGRLPIDVPDYRFDQRSEMFKRALWDGAVVPLGYGRIQVAARFWEHAGRLDHRNRPGDR